ncbi:MAG TPA: PIN domain-containing protein [Candidatus Angelobacter sp.]|jgi:predicted nucleic acid-binding protein|nr:PIN domain-containing protein [Candidatus Angelobacter sp.]
MSKTYVLDASALVIFFQKDPGFEKISRLLKEAHATGHSLLMSSVNWGETYAVILRLQGEASAQQAKTITTSLRIELVPVTPDDAVAGAEIRVRHQLRYLDSFAAALALANHATLVTADQDFQKVARRISILWLRRP